MNTPNHKLITCFIVSLLFLHSCGMVDPAKDRISKVTSFNRSLLGNKLAEDSQFTNFHGDGYRIVSYELKTEQTISEESCKKLGMIYQSETNPLIVSNNEPNHKIETPYCDRTVVIEENEFYEQVIITTNKAYYLVSLL